MKKFRPSFGDVLIIAVICLVIGFAVVTFNNSKKGTSYSLKSNEATVDEEAATLQPSGEENTNDEVVIFTPNPNKEYKDTKYTLEQVYASIRDLYYTGSGVIDPELDDIYKNFYDYYSSDKVFKNALGEEYDYDEYMFAINYSKVRTNKDLFGLYMATYSKCDVFSSIDNHSRDDKLSSYCTEEDYS